MGGGGWVYLDYNVSSDPFLSFEIEIGDGPGPELDNWIILFLQGTSQDDSGQIYLYNSTEMCEKLTTELINISVKSNSGPQLL